MESSLRLLTAATLLYLASGGCAANRPLPGPPTRAFSVPAACESPLGGLYHHAKNPDFRYQAVDDGLKLELSLLTPRGGTEAPLIRVDRTPEGFRGETRASGINGEQKPCPLAFPTEVTACDAEGLTLRTVRTTSVDERCQSMAHAAPQWVEHRLLRDADDRQPQ